MIIRKNEMPVTEHNMRNGNGLIVDCTVVPKDKMINARMFNLLTIRKGCSIGYHEHINEVEYYYILSGSGIVTENGKDVEAGPGDVVITGWGDSHSIRNDNSEDLVLLAVISTEK